MNKLLKTIDTVWQELQSAQTETELQQLLTLGADIQQQVRQMFQMGEEVSENVVRGFVVLLEIADRVMQAKGTRAVPVPAKDVKTLQQFADIVIARMV